MNFSFVILVVVLTSWVVQLGLYWFWWKCLRLTWRKRDVFIAATMTMIIITVTTSLIGLISSLQINLFLPIFSLMEVLHWNESPWLSFIPLILWGTFLISLIAVPLIWVLLRRSIKTKTVWVVSVLNVILSIYLMAAMIVFWIYWGERCNKQQMVFHEFNAHLKDVCMRNYSAVGAENECPKDESELRAYNPTRYKGMASCIATKYWFNPQTGKYAWTFRMKNETSIIVAHPDLPEAFALFEDGEWPPKNLIAPWDILKP